MIPLLDPGEVRAFLGLPPDPDDDALIRCGAAFPRTDFLAAARGWAERTYPEAGPTACASFAAVLAWGVTGFYGGYGTEGEEVEQVATDLLLAFAGGRPAARGEILAWTPPLDERGAPLLPLPRAAWTREALDLLVEVYFGAGAAEAAARAMGILLGRRGGPDRAAPAREGLLALLDKYDLRR